VVEKLGDRLNRLAKLCTWFRYHSWCRIWIGNYTITSIRLRFTNWTSLHFWSRQSKWFLFWYMGGAGSNSRVAKTWIRI